MIIKRVFEICQLTRKMPTFRTRKINVYIFEKKRLLWVKHTIIVKKKPTVLLLSFLTLMVQRTGLRVFPIRTLRILLNWYLYQLMKRVETKEHLFIVKYSILISTGSRVFHFHTAFMLESILPLGSKQKIIAVNSRSRA